MTIHTASSNQIWLQRVDVKAENGGWREQDAVGLVCVPEVPVQDGMVCGPIDLLSIAVLAGVYGGHR